MKEGSTNVTNCAFVSETREQLEHFWGDSLERAAFLAYDAIYHEGVYRTRLALVRVSSTSNKTMVSLSGRASNGGKTLAAVVILFKEYLDRSSMIQKLKKKSQDRGDKSRVERFLTASGEYE